MIDLPETLEQLSARLNALEKRVHDVDALERRVSALEEVSAPATPPPGDQAGQVLPITPSDLPSGEQISSTFLVLGKALLGIAGAYLLRALAQAAFLSRLLIAAIAIVYAIAWLLAASRTKSQRFAAVLYAATSALILAPMLWELTLRFHVLAPEASAAVLGLYVAIGTAQAWNRKSSPDLNVAASAAALTALALSIATHVMFPFVVLLLAMVAFCEYQNIRAHTISARILIELVADSAVWILLFLYRTPPATRTDYPTLATAALIALPCLLFAITAAGVLSKTTILARRITAFDSIQSVITFLLAANSPLLLIPTFSPRIIGILCLVLSAACYATAFAVFRPRPEQLTFRVFALWSAGLTLGGAFLTLPQPWAASTLALAGVVCIFIARRLECLPLERHGAAYLAVAAYASELLSCAFQSLTGAVPASISASALLVSACAVTGYAISTEREGESWRQQLLHLALASLAVYAVAALLVRGALALVTIVLTPDIHHVAFVRTLTLCCIALLSAFFSSRRRRLALRRIAYAVIVCVALKLVLEDLRHGHLEFIAASIFLFALTLIAVPRLARVRQKTALPALHQ